MRSSDREREGGSTASPYLVSVAGDAPPRGDRADVALLGSSVAVYGVTLLTVFWVSSTYHRGSWTAEEFARWQRRDHAAIFLLIAG